MANQKINDIAAAGAVTDAMQFETDIGGVTPNRVTALQIKTYCDDNIWARVGTTISPETAGDDLDMGTGTVTATTGIFNGNVEIDGYIKNPTDITFTPQASPVAITDGSMYYDSGSTKFQFRENGAWVSLGDTSVWERSGTTISPETAGDDLDMGAGDITATDAHFTGKLTVDGAIDPTMLILDPQAVAPGTDDGTLYYDSVATKFQFRESGAWVTLGDTSIWDRTGTTISPETAGDDLDMGTGDITATEAHFTSKLTVDGAINYPTVITFTAQAVSPVTSDGTIYYNSASTNFQFRENGTWVSLGDTSVWERSGTTISPETAGDDLDMGTGDISCVNLTATGGTTLSSAFVRSTPEIVVSTSFTVAVGNAGALTTLNAATPQIVTFPDGVLVVGTQGTFYNAGTADWTFAAAGSSFVISNEPLSTLPTAEQIFWKKVSSTQYYIFRTRKEGIVYTGGADYNPSILTDDCYIYVNLLTGPQNIIISTEDVQSGSSANLRMFHIKDVTGNAATNNITISLENGGNIDIGTTYVIAMNSGAVTLGLNGATARVISDFNTPSGTSIVWNRSGTTISPITGGDDLSMGAGDISATNAHFTGKLTVDGLIDPTALVLDPQAVAPGTDNGTMYYDSVSTTFKFRENGAWVTLGDTSVWERTGTTISPETAGDDLDMGTGTVNATTGVFTGNVEIDGYIKNPTNLSFTAQGSAPATDDGTIYYDSGTTNFQFRENGAWVTITTGASPFQRAVTTISPVNPGDDLDLGTGDITATDAYFTGKLTVDGAIDPTMLVLDAQAVAPGTTDGTVYYDSSSNDFQFRENGSWVTLGGGSSPFQRISTTISPVTAGDDLDMGSGEITTTDTITCGDLYIQGSTPTLRFIDSSSDNFFIKTDGDDELHFSSDVSGSNSFFRFFSKDGDGTDTVAINIFGVGSSSDNSNQESLKIEYNTGYDLFQIYSSNTGTGTLQALRLGAGTNVTTNQLLLSTDGRVGMNVATPLGQLHVDQDETDGAMPTLVLDQADVSEGFINFIGSDRGVITGATDSVESVRVEINGTVRRIAVYADA